MNKSQLMVSTILHMTVNYSLKNLNGRERNLQHIQQLNTCKILLE